MMVTVKLFANLRLDREKEQEMSLPAGSTPRDIIDRLAISEEEATIIMINGRRKELDRELVEGDTVSIFPPVGGG